MHCAGQRRLMFPWLYRRFFSHLEGNNFLGQALPKLKVLEVLETGAPVIREMFVPPVASLTLPAMTGVCFMA